MANTSEDKMPKTITLAGVIYPTSIEGSRALMAQIPEECKIRQTVLPEGNLEWALIWN